MTVETFDQSDEETWPDQKKDNSKHKHKHKHNDKDKYIKRAPSKSDPRDLWPLRHLIRMMRRHDLTKKSQWQRQIQRQRQWHKINTFREHLQRAVPQTCDLCDIWQERWGDITWQKKTMTKKNTNTVREHPERDLRDFETVITILTIGNLISWQSLLPDN